MMVNRPAASQICAACVRSLRLRLGAWRSVVLLRYLECYLRRHLPTTVDDGNLIKVPSFVKRITSVPVITRP